MQAPWSILSDIHTWAFDLDHTLYPSEETIFPKIHENMLSYMANHLGFSLDEAEPLIHEYHHRYGLSMYGLMKDHDVEPEPFLHHMHDVSLEPIQYNPALADLIHALPGRKVIFTNGCGAYAKRVLDKIGITDAFEDIFDIRSTSYQPKPQALAYTHFLGAQSVHPGQILFMDDVEMNARGAREAGMHSAWIAPEAVASDAATFSAKRLEDFLTKVHTELMGV